MLFAKAPGDEILVDEDEIPTGGPAIIWASNPVDIPEGVKNRGKFVLIKSHDRRWIVDTGGSVSLQSSGCSRALHILVDVVDGKRHSRVSKQDIL